MKSILDFKNYKQMNQKITMVTAYDYFSAQTINESHVDCILVGDSVAMVVHGYDSTIHATMEMMQMHVSAVRRGAPLKFIVGDMPFLSYSLSMEQTVANAGALIRAGANAVKIEGALGNLEVVQRLSQMGIPVMGHLGLTPQAVNALGGYKVQGKENPHAIIKDAFDLEKAGAFALVLECVPKNLALEIAGQLTIPVIGIGAGAMVDGQVLVFHDLLGMATGHRPKFVRSYASQYQMAIESLNNFHNDVLNNQFPSEKESYQ